MKYIFLLLVVGIGLGAYVYTRPQATPMPYTDMHTSHTGHTVRSEKEFITEMIPHHQGAVDMAKLLLEDTTIRPELVKFANDIITAQEAEIRQMEEWLKSY